MEKSESPVDESKPVPTAEATIGLTILKGLVRDRSLLTAMATMHDELGDIFQITMPRFQPIVVSGPELNRQVLVVDRHKFKWRGKSDPVIKLLRHGVLVEDGEMHDWLRGCMEPAMRRSPSLAHIPAMLHYTDQLLAEWPDEGELDMLVEMRRAALLILLGTLYGTDFTPDMDRLWDPILKAIHYISPGPWILWPDMPRPGYKAALKELDTYLYDLIQQRREQGGPDDDLLGRLVNSTGPDGSTPMSDGLIRDQLLTMLIAGHDTSTAMLAWVLYLLGEHPQAMAQAEAEALQLRDAPLDAEAVARLPFLDRVMKEALRLYPPIHVGNRFADEDLNLQDHEVPAGSRVMVSIYLSHRDEKNWEQPQQFCPERFERARSDGGGDESQEQRPSLAYIPFGGGPRNCIGATFAQIEGKIVLARLLQQFSLQLVPGQDIRPYMGATLEPRPGVRMIVRRRSAS